MPNFKELVNNEKSEQVRDILKKFICNISLRMNTDFETISFSDTILFYTKLPEYHIVYFHDIVYITKEFALEMLTHGIPIRGVITYGEFNVDMVDDYDCIGDGTTQAVCSHPAQTDGTFTVYISCEDYGKKSCIHT